MKKSLLALFVFAAFSLTACDDKTSQKLLEVEKKLVQLEADYQKSQAELASKSQELSQAQQALAELNQRADRLRAQPFPALQVEIVPLFQQDEHLKYAKDPQEEFSREEGMVSVLATTAQTGVDWLDTLLLKQIWQAGQMDETAPKAEPPTLSDEFLRQHFANEFAEMKKIATEEKALGYSLSSTIHYIGQRNHIATFTHNVYAYTGGAHGLGSSQYLNIDSQKLAVIQLDDLVSPRNQGKLREVLWQNFTQERLDENGKFEETFITRDDFFVPNNFYFTANGVSFVYPTYALGSYAEGEIEIFADFEQLKPFFNPSYFPSIKDGYGLSVVE